MEHYFGIPCRYPTGDVETSPGEGLEREIPACPAIESCHPGKRLGVDGKLCRYLSRFQMSTGKKFVDCTQPLSGDNMIIRRVLRLTGA